MRGIELTWAGGEHNFLLTIDLLRALQDKCDAGPMFVLGRLATSRWLVDDVIQPIRLGLEGGGLSKEEARKLVHKYVEDRPLSESVLTAKAVLMAALYGAEEDPVGELEAGAEEANSHRSREENGGSPDSTVGQGSSTETSEE